MHGGPLWLFGCVHHYYVFPEELSVYGVLDCLLERIANFKIIHEVQFFSISYSWLSFPQSNQHAQRAINVAAIASIQLSTMNIMAHVSLADLAEVLNYRKLVFCPSAVTIFVVPLIDVVNDLSKLTGYRQMCALKLTTWRQDGHTIRISTTFTAASWEMRFEIGHNWSISASSRSLLRPSPIEYIARKTH